MKLKVLKALSDKVRLIVIELLLEQKDITPNEILKAVDVDGSNLSFHLKILKEAGIIKGVRDGKGRVYSFTNPEVKRAVKTILGKASLISRITKFIMDKLKKLL